MTSRARAEAGAAASVDTLMAGAGEAPLPNSFLSQPWAFGLPAWAAFAAICTWGGMNAVQGMENTPQTSPATDSRAVAPHPRPGGQDDAVAGDVGRHARADGRLDLVAREGASLLAQVVFDDWARGLVGGVERAAVPLAQVPGRGAHGPVDGRLHVGHVGRGVLTERCEGSLVAHLRAGGLEAGHVLAVGFLFVSGHGC